jgi:hypothetical protein
MASPLDGEFSIDIVMPSADGHLPLNSSQLVPDIPFEQVHV